MGRTGVVTVLVVVVGVLVALVGAVWVAQRSLVFLPDRAQPPPAAEVLPGARDVVLRTADGLELGAWHLPPSSACAGTVLVAPGNGGNRAGRAPLGAALHEAGLGVLLLDYRGYGGNPGRPSESGLALDVRAARDHLLDVAGVPEHRLVYLGESIGAGPAADLAAEHPPAALVLRSPFTSLADAGRAAYGVPVGWLLRDRFEVREDVRRTRTVVAVVHGSADTIVPAEQSEAVAEAARAAGNDVVEVSVDGAGHNDPRLAWGPDLVSAVLEAARRGGAACG